MSDDILVVDAGGTGRSADSIYAWIVIHGPGNEAIAAVNGLPLVAVDKRLLMQFTMRVNEVASRCGKPIHLVRYEAAEVLTEVQP